jgi:hypothetical protein
VAEILHLNLESIDALTVEDFDTAASYVRQRMGE